MKRKNTLTRNIAITALFLGMILAFLQGISVYASADQNGQAEAIVAEAQNAQSVILYDEILPGAQNPAAAFPWWSYMIVIAVIAIGCGTYGFIKYQEKKTQNTFS